MAETAIIVPVDRAEAVVGRWRRRHTPSGANGMPAHVTLLAPFAPPDRLEPGLVRQVSDVLAAFPSFLFQLKEADYVYLGSRRVLYLRPTPARLFVELIDALTTTFPEYLPYDNAELTPIPHLTVATSPNDSLLSRIEEAVHPGLPILATATEAWIVEYGEVPFRIRSRIKLG